jgi:hypothetical protein
MKIEHVDLEWTAKRRNNAEAMSVVRAAAPKVLSSAGKADVAWLTNALNDDNHKLFVAALCMEASALPEELFTPLIRAAVNEPSPLQVQAFVEPCIRAFGRKRVYQTLIEYVEKATDYEKAGAVNALHWAAERKSSDSGRHRVMDQEMMALQDYLRILYLRTFINNPDVDLRRSLLTHMELNPIAPPMAVQEMIDKVVKISRMHADEYIRNRVEVQLGRAPSAYPLPPRKRGGTEVTRKSSWWKQLWK